MTHDASTSMTINEENLNLYNCNHLFKRITKVHENVLFSCHQNTIKVQHDPSFSLI